MKQTMTSRLDQNKDRFKSEKAKLAWFQNREPSDAIKRAESITKSGGNPQNVKRPDVFGNLEK